MKDDTKKWDKDDSSFFKRFTYIIAFGVIAAFIIGILLSAEANDQASVVAEINVNTQTVMELTSSAERTEYLLFVQSILDDSTISRYELSKEHGMFQDAVEADEEKELKKTKAALLKKVSNTLEWKTLQGVNFKGAVFIDVDLSDADLTGVYMDKEQKASLDLSKAQLKSLSKKPLTK